MLSERNKSARTLNATHFIDKRKLNIYTLFIAMAISCALTYLFDLRRPEEFIQLKTLKKYLPCDEHIRIFCRIGFESPKKKNSAHTEEE